MSLEPPNTREPLSEEARALEKVHQVELVISTLLRAGVILSFCVVLAGMALTFLHHPEYSGSMTMETRPVAFPHSVADVLRGVMDLRGQSVILLGIAILIATPVLRVGISIFAFMYQRDRTYVVITSIVLFLLLASFALGKIEG